MPLPAQKLREVVFQMLYSSDIGKATDENMLSLLSQELKVPKSAVRTAQLRVHQMTPHLKEIDRKIGETSHSYAFERIQTVERNILRLAIFELLFDNDIPEKVAISEAMRLAKKFATKESAHFVNAILDAIYKESKGLEIDETKLDLAASELGEIEKVSEEAAQHKPLTPSSDEQEEED